MIKLIVGIKGTGKTKQLIDMANAAVTATKGCVICVEKGNKLIHEIKYQARLVDVDEYAIDDALALRLCERYVRKQSRCDRFVY